MSSPTSRQHASGPTVDASSMGFQVAFRDRLADALDRVGVPIAARQAYLASLTSRAPQTVSRWLDMKKPGSPDLESFRRLCMGLRCSSDSLLDIGLDAAASSSSPAVLHEAAWAQEVFQSMRCEYANCDVLRMRGDEMAPTIRDGDAIFVDRGLHQILGSGIYALELGGRTIVRRVEAGLGLGLTLKCEQAGYREHVLEDEAAASRMGLRVLGKVFGVVGVTRFWSR